MVRAVCFSPTKRKLFSEVQNSCIPIKIIKTSSSRGDLVVNKWSNVSLLKSVPFEYDHMVSTEDYVTIAHMSQLANLEFVKVKAAVASVEDPIESSNRTGNRARATI
eukprot:TCONS_00035493-protein